MLVFTNQLPYLLRFKTLFCFAFFKLISVQYGLVFFALAYFLHFISQFFFIIFISFRFASLHFISRQFISLLFTSFHFISFRFISLCFVLSYRIPFILLYSCIPKSNQIKGLMIDHSFSGSCKLLLLAEIWQSDLFSQATC